MCGMKIFVEQYWGIDKSKSGMQDKGCEVMSPSVLQQKKRNRSRQESSSTTQQQQPVKVSSETLMKSEIKFRSDSDSQPIKQPATQKAQNPPKNSKMTKAASMNSLNFGTQKAVATMEPAISGLATQHRNALSDKVKSVLSDFPHWLSLER